MLKMTWFPLLPWPVIDRSGFFVKGIPGRNGTCLVDDYIIPKSEARSLCNAEMGTGGDGIDRRAVPQWFLRIPLYVCLYIHCQENTVEGLLRRLSSHASLFLVFFEAPLDL
jgi:hypothetical protein